MQIVQPQFEYTGWELHPDCLIKIQELLLPEVEETHSLNVLEFGSGKSTEVLIQFAKVNNLSGKHLAFDAYAPFAHPTAEITPLQTYPKEVFGPDFVFYDRKIVLENIDDYFSEYYISLCIVDGHHGHGRSMAFSILKDVVGGYKGTYVVIDDFDHYPFIRDFLLCFPDAKEICRHWEDRSRWVIFQI